MHDSATSTIRTSLKASTDVRAIFEEHADLVWRVLARAGVRDADLKDASQEVFIIVANKLEQRDEDTKMTTWIYGISVRVAANHRRKVQRKREDLSAEAGAELVIAERDGPEEVVERARARMRLAELLDALPDAQRIVFELFELEELTCQAIADTLGIPLGTVYTRLRAARAVIAARAAEAFGE